MEGVAVCDLPLQPAGGRALGSAASFLLLPPAGGMPLGLPRARGGDRLEASRDLGGREMLLKK